jgi:hypothetical protein
MEGFLVLLVVRALILPAMQRHMLKQGISALEDLPVTCVDLYQKQEILSGSILKASTSFKS